MSPDTRRMLRYVLGFIGAAEGALVLLLGSFLLMGADSTAGCGPQEGVHYDVYVPRLFPEQPTMRQWHIWVDGILLPPPVYQGSFVAGLSPTQTVEVCMTCGTVVQRGQPGCPEYLPFGIPSLRDPQPCILSCQQSTTDHCVPCETWDQDFTCFPPRWYSTLVDVRSLKRNGIPSGGPRFTAGTGAYLGYR